MTINILPMREAQEKAATARKDVQLKRQRIGDLETDISKYDELAQASADGSPDRLKFDQQSQHCERMLTRAKADLPALVEALDEAEYLVFQASQFDDRQKLDERTRLAHIGNDELAALERELSKLAGQVAAKKAEQAQEWTIISRTREGLDMNVGSFASNHVNLQISPAAFISEMHQALAAAAVMDKGKVPA